MRDNMTNKEEAEWLLSWWKNYGQGILFAVVIGLVIGFGWKYWMNDRQKKAMHTSDLYQQTQPSLASSPTAAKAAQTALIKQFPKSIYTQLTYLQQSNDLIAAAKYTQAQQLLQKILVKPVIPAIGQMAQLKIAQIQIQLKQPQAALTTLNQVTDNTFQALVDNAKARAYALLGQNKLAKQYLAQALAAYKKQKVDTFMLQLNQGLLVK